MNVNQKIALKETGKEVVSTIAGGVVGVVAVSAYFRGAEKLGYSFEQSLTTLLTLGIVSLIVYTLRQSYLNKVRMLEHSDRMREINERNAIERAKDEREFADLKRKIIGK